MLITLLIIALSVLAGLGLLIFVGLRSGHRDLVSPPAEFGVEANARPELPRIEPDQVELPPKQARPEIASPTLPPEHERPEIAVTEELLDDLGAPNSPEMPSDEAIGDAPPREDGPWEAAAKPVGTPSAKTESDYTAEELVDREVRAMLIQDRRDRAVGFARSGLGISAQEAEEYVTAIERKTG